MVSDEFKERFLKELQEEFDAKTQTAEDVARMAAQYNEEQPVTKSTEEWLKWLKLGEGELIERWNYTIGMVARDQYKIGPDGQENPYKL